MNRTFENLSKFNQDLCRNTQCLKYMIDIMADCMHLDTKFNIIPEKINIVYMINLIIAESCHQSKKNKEYLSEFLEPLFLKYIKNDSIGYNVCTLLNNLLENNKTILLETQRCKYLFNQIFESMIGDKENYYRIAYNLYTLQSCIFYKDKCLRKNQNILISSLISTKLQPVFKRVSSYMLVNTIVQDLKQPSFFFSYGGMNVSMVTPKMCFTLSYIDVISNCSFDKNAFAENIAQSLITVDDLEALLKIDVRHPLFDYELFKLIYHVYIDTEKTYSTQIEIFLLEAMLEVKKILFKTLDIVGRGHSTVYYLTHKELVSSENVYNDLISTCINNLRLFIANISKDETTKIDLK